MKMAWIWIFPWRQEVNVFVMLFGEGDKTEIGFGGENSRYGDGFDMRVTSYISK